MTVTGAMTRTVTEAVSARRALVATWTVLIGACTFTADFEGTRYRCEASDVCPDGYGCVRGVCLAGLSDLGSCGTMAVAAHDFLAIDFANFDDSSIWRYSVDDPATIAVEGGQLVLAVPDTAEDVGSAFKLDKLFPRAGSEIAVEIIERSPDETSGAYLLIEDRAGDHVEFYEEAGRLYAVLHTSVDELVLAELAFDPIVHRFWRIREQDGEFIFATSPDGAQWTEHARDLGTDVDGWLGAEVGLWKWGTGGGQARLVVDNLNGGVSDVDFCPSLSLQDDFDDGVKSSEWQIRDTGGCLVYESEGRVGFEFPDSGASECTYHSNTRFDLRASTISIEAPVADIADLEQCLKLRIPGGIEVEFELYEGQLRGEKDTVADDDTLFEVSFDPVAHRYWRFRGAGNTVFWEVSPDGHNWQVMASHESPDWNPGQVAIDIIGDTDTGQVANPGMGVDNLNIVPPPR